MNVLDQIRSDNCDEVELLEYITDNNIEIAIAVAESKLATEPILDIAAMDNDRNVRYAALNNPNIGKRTLEKLTSDTDVEIAKKASELLGGNI